MKKHGWMAAAGAGLALIVMGAAGQPPAKTDHPKAKEKAEERAEDPAVQHWREEFKQELKEHPRIARSLVELHVTKEHLKNAPHDFGGHRVAAIAAIDEAIKQLKEAIKFDAQQDAKDEKHDGDKHTDKPDHEKHKKEGK